MFYPPPKTLYGMREGGLFIVLEGIDGCGKSTHSRLLAEGLRGLGYRVVETCEPTDGPVGRLLRGRSERGLRFPAEVEALLYAADRLLHVEGVVEPALREGYVVVSERYIHSSIAYQGAEGVDVDWIRMLNRSAPQPDLAVLLDIQPKTAVERLRGRRLTAYEDYETQRRVREIYLRLAEAGELVRVDAERSMEEVQRELLHLALERLRR
ncbi:MAG: thymidylate kinase [Candidatus Bathyarchaeota archaeon B23]|nr:MAG: thymidylate kinase [Candidatus Bathyarchaeota archaeon B23]